MSAPELAIFGSLTIDNVVRANGEIMPQYFGGNAVYAALGARVWSDSVGVVSRYGEGYPLECFDLLRSLGIDASGIRRIEGPHRMNVAFAYRADGSRTRIIPPEILAGMSEIDRQRFHDSSTRQKGHLILEQFGAHGGDMPEEWWDGIKGIHCASMPLARLLDIAETARARTRRGALRIHVDSPWHDSIEAKELDAGVLLRTIDLLLPSEQDLENYRPGVPHDRVAIDLLAQGVPALVLKRGPAGCRIFRSASNTVTNIPVFSVDVVDPTGAGDSFCGGFLAGFLKTGDLRMAAHYGVVSASFCVEARGLDGLVAADRIEAARRLTVLSEATGLLIKPTRMEGNE